MARKRNLATAELTSKYHQNHRFRCDSVGGCEGWTEQGIWLQRLPSKYQLNHRVKYDYVRVYEGWTGQEIWPQRRRHQNIN